MGNDTNDNINEPLLDDLTDDIVKIETQHKLTSATDGEKCEKTTNDTASKENLNLEDNPNLEGIIRIYFEF